MRRTLVWGAATALVTLGLTGCPVGGSQEPIETVYGPPPETEEDEPIEDVYGAPPVIDEDDTADGSSAGKTAKDDAGNEAAPADVSIECVYGPPPTAFPRFQ